MKTAFVLLMAVLSCGFLIDVPESAESIKRREKFAQQRAKEERVWRKEVSRNYDLERLRTFLDQMIREHPTVDGVSLAKAKTEGAWKFNGHALICGDWGFYAEKPKQLSFALKWTYEVVQKADGGNVIKTVVLKCVRESKGGYQFLSAQCVEDEEIVLSL